MFTQDLQILFAQWLRNAERILTEAWRGDQSSLLIVGLAVGSVILFVAAIAMPFRRRRSTTRFCDWRPDGLLPQTESGHWRWKCRHCGESAFGTDKRAPVECVRLLKPRPL